MTETNPFRGGNVTLRIRPLRKHVGLPLPTYESEGSSGMDLRACIEAPLSIDPGKIRLVPTGIAISIPPGYEVQIRPRSGLALKHGIGMVNSPGTIDSDYRGEIGIILINWGERPFVVKRGDRIAQMVISKVCRATILETDHLDSTQRGDGGFGHTGIR